MNQSSTQPSSKKNHSSPPLNTVLGAVSSAASIADAHKPVLMTGSSFHRNECSRLRLAKAPKSGRLWQTYYLIVFPCRWCWPDEFVRRWQSGLRSRHRNCAPHRSLDSRPERAKRRPVGRPRALPLGALQRVLSRYGPGNGYLSMVRELRRDGYDVSRASVQRAVKRKPPYSDPVYDRVYETNGYPSPTSLGSRSPPKTTNN
jgi:hypothetical protein